MKVWEGREPRKIVRLDRAEFIEKYFDYSPGQHVSIIGETGNGKTTLALQLLKATAKPELPAVILAMKPKDDTIDKFQKEVKADGLDYRLVTTWPPSPSMWKPGKPDGYVLAPKHLHETHADRAAHSDIFNRALMDSYKKGKRIIFADEAFSLSEELDLGDDLDTLWTKGRSMGCGVWAATQRPARVPLNMYSQASHLFLDWPSDKRARDRYREIGGCDPDVVLAALYQASEVEFSFVYLLPKGRRTKICIVGP